MSHIKQNLAGETGNCQFCTKVSEKVKAQAIAALEAIRLSNLAKEANLRPIKMT